MPYRPKIESVESVFGDQAVHIRLSGRQSAAFATPVRKLLFWLSSKGKRHFVFDLRDATYPRNELGSIVETVVSAARVLPKFHVALLHKGEDMETVRNLMHANRRIGNQVLDVYSLEEARNWMFPGFCEEPEPPSEDYFDLDSLDQRRRA